LIRLPSSVANCYPSDHFGKIAKFHFSNHEMISLISTMKDGRVIYLPDDDQSVIPDLTPETVEPEPSSGEATNPINLTDELMKHEADKNSTPIPASYCHLEKVCTR
jgi:hypothetical protein